MTTTSERRAQLAVIDEILSLARGGEPNTIPAQWVEEIAERIRWENYDESTSGDSV